MTPEERAAQIVNGELWLDANYFADAGGEEYRTEGVNRDTLQREIAEAIRAAEDAMRERCAQVAEGTFNEERLYEGVRNGDNILAAAIRATGKGAA